MLNQEYSYSLLRTFLSGLPSLPGLLGVIALLGAIALYYKLISPSRHLLFLWLSFSMALIMLTTAFYSAVYEFDEQPEKLAIYDPADNERLGHSLGLKKGMLGVVTAFASNKMTCSNNVIIAHELLHTVGATDKYVLATNQPLYPMGFAEPERKPLYPQRKAELMAGRIPVAQNKALMPRSLTSVVIGEASAIEILWR